MGDAEADCREVLERIYLYLDGELPVEQVAAIGRHLDLCPPCLQQVGFERDLKTVIRRACSKEDVPAELADRIRARLREIL